MYQVRVEPPMRTLIRWPRILPINHLVPTPNEEPNEPEFLRGYVPTDLEDRKGHLLERINHLPDDKDGNQVSHNDTTALPLGFDVSNGDLGDLPSGNFPSSGGWV